MHLHELVSRSFDQAVRSGWQDPAPTFGEHIALIHSELSEALESFRNKEPLLWYKKEVETTPGKFAAVKFANTSADFEVTESGELMLGRGRAVTITMKPEGVASELADVLIRIGHLAGALGADLELAVEEKMQYNATRPRRHGGKVL